ncbi:MAG: HD domain-containing phosphohydrolase, partial [Syntrophothermus sp.]
ALGAGLLLWALGQTYYSAVLYYASPAPFPSPADALFLAFYPATYVGLVLLLRARLAHLDPLGWLDWLIGALAIAAVAAALIFPPVLEALGGDALGVSVNLAYPCADLVLLGLLSGALATSGLRANGALLLIGSALLLFAVGDVVYLSAAGQSTAALRFASVAWPAAFLLIAAAAWLPRGASAQLEGEAPGHRIVGPIGFAAAAVALLALGNLTAIGGVAVGLSVACLAAVLARLAITFDHNRQMLRSSRREAVTDALTGLGNRRRLMRDLRAALEPARGQRDIVLVLLDLDGFKAYNDSFGHPAGDELLRRLGRRLADEFAADGSAYRLGGDEFCVLATIDLRDEAEICAAAAQALSQAGAAFEITASWGMAELPDEAATPADALRLADRRMYATKGRRADSARSQTRGVLLSVLHEREPDLDRRLDGVASLAADLGRALRLDAEDLDVLVRAAELHDIGKIAIPDEVLHKRGPLTDSEWALMRRHTLIGERVLNAAPALRRVARIVRSTHERWDGGGYPDGLAGSEIPLGSRMILICDAFNAMTEGRAYRAPMSIEAAREALRAGAGTQFDPRLVDLFLDRVAQLPPLSRV